METVKDFLLNNINLPHLNGNGCTKKKNYLIDPYNRFGRIAN